MFKNYFYGLLLKNKSNEDNMMTDEHNTIWSKQPVKSRLQVMIAALSQQGIT